MKSIWDAKSLRLIAAGIVVINGFFPALWILLTSLKTETELVSKPITYFPHNPTMKNAFAGEEKKAHAETTAFRNGSMQGGYFIIAARAVGLGDRGEIAPERRADLVVDIQSRRMAAGEILLLCSDGLTTMLPDEDIARILGYAGRAAMIHRDDLVLIGEASDVT